MRLPKEFSERMRRQLKGAYPAYEEAMRRQPARGIRVNTLKIDREWFLERAPWRLEPVEYAQDSFELMEEVTGIGAHAWHRAGLFYVQEPSAMRPAAVLGAKPGMRVLDLCAAPGGKAGQVAACLGGQGILVANEVVPGRAAVLKGNLERLGVRNALVTCQNPEELVKHLRGYFDAVLVDAPCSGEGMFRKEPRAVADWSLAHVRACAARQSHILGCAAQAVKEGGRLVYSTCTFAEEENEQVVRAFLRENPVFSLEGEERLYPHTGRGEGQFVAAMRKEGGEVYTHASAQEVRLPREAAAAWEHFQAECLHARPNGQPMLLPDGRLLLLPESLPEGYRRLRLLNAGVLAGEYKNGRVKPAHALCMAYPKECFKRALELTDEQLTAFMQGHTLEAGGTGNGYVVLLAGGFPVGWGKAVDGVIKNHLPKGLREQSHIEKRREE